MVYSVCQYSTAFDLFWKLLMLYFQVDWHIHNLSSCWLQADDIQSFICASELPYIYGIYTNWMSYFGCYQMKDCICPWIADIYISLYWIGFILHFLFLWLSFIADRLNFVVSRCLFAKVGRNIDFVSLKISNCLSQNRYNL